MEWEDIKWAKRASPDCCRKNFLLNRNISNNSAIQWASGRGSLVVKVSDRGWHVTSSSPIPLKTYRIGGRCTLNLSRAQTSSRWCGVIVRKGGDTAQESSLSLDHGSKLRRPSPKALV
ncbi:uncharacterized protein TNCV_330801 [Trichonephila clavipes]|nr:uncharacterized protein TNCV_330801 [Trichonephila clavipes]